MIKILKKCITKELIVYGVVGALTTLVNFLVSFLMNDVLHCSFSVLTNTVAWVAAVSFAYVTNNTWVFQIGFEGWKKEVLKMSKFFLARMVTWALEAGGMLVLVDWMGFGFWPIKIGISVLVIILNYVFSKLFIFFKKNQKNV